MEEKKTLEEIRLEIKRERGQREMNKHFIMFGRNGRWGTCASCPCDSLGMNYPEFCPDTRRGDHHLTVEQLGESWRIKTENRLNVVEDEEENA